MRRQVLHAAKPCVNMSCLPHAGGRVDLAEVEAALCRYPAVAVAAAKLWQLPAGPILAAYVQLTEALPSGSSPTGSDLQDWCRQRLQPAAVPQHVALLPQLPLSASGKVQRSQLLQPQEVVDSRAASAGEPVGPPSKRLRASPAAAPAAAVTELQTSLVFAAALGHSDFEATSNLFALGGNSLMAAQIAGAVAGGDVEAVLQHPTVRALTAFLNSRAQAGATPAAAAGTIQQLAAPPAAVVAARRLSINGGGEQQQDQQQPGAMLQLAWRARMLQCVDAAPVLEAQPQAGCSPRIFACSHGGDVCCYDASSGQQLWQTQLPDCTDAGLALCRRPAGSGDKLAAGQQFVAAATNSGTLVFLDAASGAETGSVACGGGIRAPPACDPWCGLVWQPTHGRQLVVAAAPGAECLRLPLPAAVSAAVAFDAEQRLAYVSCLDGTLLAIAVEPASLAATAAAAAASGSRLQLAAAWQHQFGAPLFAPPLVLPGGRVVAAAVDGGVAGFGGRDGSQLWQASVGSAVFAPLLAADSQRVLLAGMQSGKLAAIACSSGQQLAAVELGAKVTGLQLLPSGAQDAQELLVATLAPGIVVLADATRLLSSAGSGSSVLDAVQLPSDVFAPPAVGSSDGGRPCVAVGCRDDHLYCLSVHAPVVD